MSNYGHSLRIPVAAWQVWDSADKNDATDKPDVGFIEPMLRRRLSPVARAALSVAYACAKNIPSVRLVYASRHGELERTVGLLQTLGASQDLSPTAFGLSVLNANAGLYSIARNDTAPSTAIAAGEETFGFGLIEAWGRAVTEKGPPVLYVYADAPAPTPLGPRQDDHPGILALAFLIDPQHAKQHLLTEYTHLEHHEAGLDSPRASSAPQATTFVRETNHLPRITWQGAQRHWQWTWE